MIPDRSRIAIISIRTAGSTLSDVNGVVELSLLLEVSEQAPEVEISSFHHACVNLHYAGPVALFVNIENIE